MDRISREERQEKLTEAGFRVANYGDFQTHAICVHGVITGRHHHHHSCIWLPLVVKGETNDDSKTA